MKKIIYTLLVAVLALSFMGCPSVYEDLAPQVDLTGFYLRGDMNGWGTDDALVAKEDGTYSVKFTSSKADNGFKVATEDWGTEFGYSGIKANLEKMPAGVVYKGTDDGFGGLNSTLAGLTPSKTYEMIIVPGATDITIEEIKDLGFAVPMYYALVDGNPVSFSYDDGKYTYEFVAEATTETLTIWSEGTYYNVEVEAMDDDAVKATGDASKENKFTITNLTVGLKYRIVMKDLSVTVEMCLPYMVGAINYKDGNVFTEFAATETPGVYTFEFTYKTSMSSNWGSPANGVAFKVTPGIDDWNAFFKNAELTVGGGFVEKDTGSGDNAVITGLEDGETYIITLDLTGTAKAKVEKK
jgi:hypothetical protein